MSTSDGEINELVKTLDEIEKSITNQMKYTPPKTVSLKSKSPLKPKPLRELR